MNSIKVFCAAALLVSCQVYGRPQESSSVAPPKGNITLLKNEVAPLDAKGSYSYDIELSDGTKLIQSGHTELPNGTESSIVIEGSYAYIAPDGKQISITYIADKNGFQPKGDAIPTVGNATSTAGAAASSSPSAAPPAAAASSAPPAPAAPTAPAAPPAPAVPAAARA